MPEDSRPRLLIVDDDPLITETLSYALGKDFKVMVSDSRHHAVSLLRQLDEAPQLALVDLGLPPMPHRPDEGFQLIGDLLAHSPTMKILVLSGQNDAANARHARTLGAAEFVAKPCDPENLKKILLHALQFRAAEISREGIAETDPLVGKSPALQKLKSQISQYADSPFPALIEGESGTGKEVVANLLHRLSWRRVKPWFALNCAAIAPTLVEPTLFGYTKGAFTGATQNKSGYFEDASDGTLFLDEIGELPLELQAKLLRVLENGEFQRVGETQQRFSRSRVIAATNRDLRQEVRKGNFRADLYHRLSVFTIEVPSLREMEEDRTLLLEHYRKFYAEQAKLPPFALDEAAQKAWRAYHFPGNVRELRNVVIRLTTKYAGQKLSLAELEPEFDLEAQADGGPGLPSDPGTLEALLYAITHDEGIVKVSGEVGSGKTMLCRVLMERLPAAVETIYLANPSLSRDEILFAIGDELKLELEKGPRILRVLQEHLLRLFGEGRRVVVLIDEAHAMPDETLEEIRLLSNLESNRHKLLQIVLFGQPELDEHLDTAHMRQLKERITQSFRLEPLVRSDIERYIDFRMRAAGYRGPEVFTRQAIKLIANASQGLTRRVNILSDKALLAAFADGTHAVTAAEVKRAVRD